MEKEFGTSVESEGDVVVSKISKLTLNKFAPGPLNQISLYVSRCHSGGCIRGTQASGDSKPLRPGVSE